MSASEIRSKQVGVRTSWSVVAHTSPTLLLGLFFALPFVVPVHRAPIPTFDVEVVSAVLLSVLAIALGASSRQTTEIRLPLPVWAACMVGVVAIQQAAGLLAYSSQLALACVYAFGIFSAYWVGRNLLARGLLTRTSTVIATGLVLAGGASVVLQILQALDVRGLPWWLYFEVLDPWLRTRPFGNLGQANLLSTYLVWAMFGALLLHQRGLKAGFAIGLLFLFAVGVALTRSRLGVVLCIGVVASLWVPWSLRPSQIGVRAWMTLAIAIGYVASSGAMSLFLVYEGAGVESALGRFGEAGGFAIRMVMWSDALRVAASSPWIGVGFGEYAKSHYWIAQDVPHLQATTYVHNLVLQSAADFGLPMAVGLIFMGLWWVLAGLKERLADPATAFAWVLLVVMGLHSLLEWPLAALHFLLPTALLFALAEPKLPQSMSVRAESRLLGLAGIAGVVLALPMWLEFDELSDVMLHAEVERRSETGLSDRTLSRLLALGEASRLRYYPERLLVFLRSPESVEPNETEIARHERLLVQGADPQLIARLILLYARAGRLEESLRHVERLKVFHRGDFESLTDTILAGLKDLGAEVDPVRTALSRHADRLKREGLDWRIKWRRDLIRSPATS